MENNLDFSNNTTYSGIVTANQEPVAFQVTGPSEFIGAATFKNCIQLEELKNELQEIKKMIYEIYYAPGMPGYYMAKESFEDNQKKRKS